MSRRGQSLLGAVLLMAALLATLPLIVYCVQNESRWTVKQGRSSAAYHMAEAAQDRAVYYLGRSSATWVDAVIGNPDAGYRGDVQYNDIPGGLYSINISSGPGAGQVTVLTKARDASSKEVRAIQAVYASGAGDASAGPFLSGFVAQGAVTVPSSLQIYWGSITSYSSLTLGSPAAYHPLKYAKTSVSPWDTSPTPPNGNAAKGYTAYDQNLAAPPPLDFDYYRALAQQTAAPNPASLGGSYGSQSSAWRGTGYFDAGTKGSTVHFKNYTLDCSTCAIFVEGDDVTLEGSGYMHLSALIVKAGNIHIHSAGANPYVVSVPTAAWQQYAAGTAVSPNSPDTAAVDEYPGDGGYQATKPTYSIPTAVFDGASNTGMAFHGLLYAYSFNCSGGDNTLVGQFYVGPGGTKVNTMVLYYDPDVATTVRYASGQVQRSSWQETLATWP